MIILHWLSGISIALAQTAGSTATPPATAPQPSPSSSTMVVPMDGFNLGKQSGNPITKAQTETILSKCSDRRFEASADGMIDGALKHRRITLCAAPGESDLQWTVRLENAVVWVRAQKDLSDPVKDELVTKLRDEIGRVKSRERSAGLLSSALPAADALVATVPPMPPPLPSQTMSSSSLLASAILARLPLTIRCLVAGERGNGGRCDKLEPETVFVVHADANLASPAILRFLRRGETRAEIPVVALRQGQTVRVKLPPELCSRVIASVVTIEVLARDRTTPIGTRVAEELGPFRLRC